MVSGLDALMGKTEVAQVPKEKDGNLEDVWEWPAESGEGACGGGGLLRRHH